MSHDRVALLLVDYVQQTLDDETRAVVDAHLLQCAECREALETATELRRLVTLDDPTLLGHVQAQHLVAFAERRLEGPVAGWVEQHVAECEACETAVVTLREKPAFDVKESASWWRFLRRTMLAPAPALAYLLLIAILIPVAFRKTERKPAEPAAVEILPAPVRLFGDDSFRGSDGKEPEVVEIVVAQGEGFVHLELVTDLDLAELQATPEVGLELLSDDGRSLYSGVAYEVVDDVGLARMVLPTQTLDSGRTYRVVIRSPEPSANPLFEAAFKVLHSSR